MRIPSVLAIAAFVGASVTSVAAPVHYTVDPNHTFPNFEAPHIEGISIWRGKFNKTEGTIVLDRAAKTGTADITIQANSVNFGLDVLDKRISSPEYLDAEKYPTIVYKGTSMKFVGDAPTEVMGTLTLHGVTKPVTLKVNEFKCIMHPMRKKEVCGADVSAEISRTAFGIDATVKETGDWVKFQIQIEATKDDAPAT